LAPASDLVRPGIVALHPELADIWDGSIWAIEHVWPAGCSGVDESVDLSRCSHLDGIYPISCAFGYHIGSDADGKEEKWCEKHDSYCCYYRVVDFSLREGVGDDVVDRERKLLLGIGTFYKLAVAV
jgi:hypothetical protein